MPGEGSGGDHVERAAALVDLRRFEEALVEVGRATAARPQDERPHVIGSRALLGLGRHQDAVQAASWAVHLAPSSATAFQALARALIAAGRGARDRRTLEAVDAAQQAVRLAPGEPSGLALLAEALARAGRSREADAAVRQALAQAPTSPAMWVAASVVALRAKSWYAAETAARRALALDPLDAAAKNNLGVALKRQDQGSFAAVAYLSAARLDPHDPTAANNLESFGFEQLRAYLTLLLLPLLVVAPLFVAASAALGAWLRKRPERLRPVARKLGMRHASSRRHQRRFERHNARLQRLASDASLATQWSAMKGRRRASNGVLGLGGGALLVIGLACIAASFLPSSDGGGTGPGVFGLALVLAGAALLHRLWSRSHRF